MCKWWLCALLGLSSYAMAVEKELLEKAERGEISSISKLAKQYCKEGDYKSSLYWYEKKALLAKEDSFNYNYNFMYLADAYLRGTCAPYDTKFKEQQFEPDYKLALEWLNKLIYQKQPENSSIFQTDPYLAKFKAADIYFWGERGIPKDVMIAKMYYKELAELDDETVNKKDNKINKLVMLEVRGNARYRLAQMYFHGEYMLQDDNLAFEWGRKSFQDGNEYGGMIVAKYLYEGINKHKNTKKALEIVKLVCENRSLEEACIWYKDMKANRPLSKVAL
ncbi:hypothetical protein [Haemophilus parahaemolyticus]|uniref:tetratricopeptide repeat protein n=1 Tax=Haemophilus parahaemolyticus TaxID=735 RepID=UPI0028E4FACC|nr:hypothetical protein [Haemophilus parahaemolyticus]